MRKRTKIGSKSEAKEKEKKIEKKKKERWMVKKIKEGRKENREEMQRMRWGTRGRGVTKPLHKRATGMTDMTKVQPWGF